MESSRARDSPFFPSAFLWHLDTPMSRTDLLDPILTVLDKGMHIFTLYSGGLLAPWVHHYSLYLVPWNRLFSGHSLIPELFSVPLPPPLHWIEADERRRQWLLVVFVGHVFLDSLSPCGPHWPAFKNSLPTLGRGGGRSSTQQLSLWT